MKKIALLSLCLLLVLALGLFTVSSWWQQGGTGQGTVLLEIREGSSLTRVAGQLSDKKLLNYPRLWRLMTRWQQLDGSIKPGEFELEYSMSPAQLLQALVAGKVRQYQVTLPEGITLTQALAILHSKNTLRAELDGALDPRLLDMVQPHLSTEGWFFPDTYSYTKGTSDLQILHMAYRRMQEVLTQSWQSRASGLPYTTAYEALIMASIVERETGVARERGEIAGVFVRRLFKKMKLQTDPTIIYGLGERYDGNIRRSHLKDESNPYNTYRHGGLPPGPIGLPGAAAIAAALHPEPGKSLYFVARGDGSHQFSETFEEHKAAVARYQLQRREDYRSSPPTEQ